MATRRTRSAIGCGAGERPADGRLPLRPAGGVGKVKAMLHLGAPRAGTGARTAPVPVAPVEKRQSRLGRWFDNWLRSVGMAVILFVIIKTFLVEAFQIPSGSMERTLLAGDFLFVNKAVYGAQIPGTHARLPGFEAPRRGAARRRHRVRVPEEPRAQLREASDRGPGGHGGNAQRRGAGERPAVGRALC